MERSIDLIYELATHVQHVTTPALPWRVAVGIVIAAFAVPAMIVAGVLWHRLRRQ